MRSFFLLWVFLGSAVMAEEGDIVLSGPWKACLITTFPTSDLSGPARADPGISNAAKAAIATDFDDATWGQVEIPGYWEAYGGVWKDADGEGVFRRWVDLPAGSADKDFELCLGAIDDVDITYVNGEQVGQIDKNVVGHWILQRCYRIPRGLLTDGRNLVAVRVFDGYGGGGFTGPKDTLLLRTRK